MTTIPSTNFTGMAGWDQAAAGPHFRAVPGSGSAEPSHFKQQIIASLGEVAEQFAWLLSATLTGSFLHGAGLEGISDIDFVLVVDRLDAERMERLQSSFRRALSPVLAGEGFSLRINPTLGPLKFNDERTAVLHLMIYSLAAHVEHVVHSPFTCLDWQRSDVVFKRPLAEIYPVFGLQPHHFLSARRSIQDYLRDFRAGVVSYRELQCDAGGYREVRREKPMTARDRHEFAHHILRFLMQNTLKLLLRRNDAPEGALLLDQFVVAFGDCGGALRPLYHELSAKKRSRDFNQPLSELDQRLAEWIGDYEQQFRDVFQIDARRHVLFRHAATSLNPRQVENRSCEPRFLGRSNPSIEPLATDALGPLAKAIKELAIGRVFCSPLDRCQQSLSALADQMSLARSCLDARLEEIDYGHCEGLTADEARRQFPRLAAGWERGEDVRFPDGECTADVSRRLESFIDGQWDVDGPDTLTCTHNVVLRCLVGQALGVPRTCWHRLRIPHLAPITVIQTRRHGWFVDLDEGTEREIFGNFVGRPS